MSAFTASLRRELDWLRGNRWDRTLLTLAPLLALVILGAVFFTGSPRLLPVAVVDADHSGTSRLLLRKLDASAQVEVVAEPTQLDDAWPLVRTTRVWAVVYIPPHFERDVLAGRGSAVIVYRNASFYSAGGLAGHGVVDTLQALNAELLPELAQRHSLPEVRLVSPRVQATVLFNPQTSYEWFLEALLQPGILHVMLSCAVVVALGRELRAGALAGWLGAPAGFARAGAALAGKLAPYVLVFFVWQLVATTWLCGWRGWGIHGSALLLALGQFALYGCYAALAALIALALRDTYVALSVVAMYGGPALTFSDATLPIIDAPLFTRVWSHVLPFSAYVKLQMEQMVMGSPAGTSLTWVALLAIVGAVAFLGAVLLLRRQSRALSTPCAQAA